MSQPRVWPGGPRDQLFEPMAAIVPSCKPSHSKEKMSLHSSGTLFASRHLRVLWNGGFANPPCKLICLSSFSIHMDLHSALIGSVFWPSGPPFAELYWQAHSVKAICELYWQARSTVLHDPSTGQPFKGWPSKEYKKPKGQGCGGKVKAWSTWKALPEYIAWQHTKSPTGPAIGTFPSGRAAGSPP